MRLATSRRTIWWAVGASLLFCAGVGHAREQLAQADPKAPPAVSSEPQQTSATFGDWVVRCARSETGSKRMCEAAQSVVLKGQSSPVAQVAFGTIDGASMITILLPTNLSFSKPPAFGLEGDEPKPMVLNLRRCVPGGCFADAKVDAGTIRQFRDATKLGRLAFVDAGEHAVALPVSLRGLPQALDALARESGR